jgi:hypothetical protein
VSMPLSIRGKFEFPRIFIWLANFFFSFPFRLIKVFNTLPNQPWCYYHIIYAVFFLSPFLIDRVESLTFSVVLVCIREAWIWMIDIWRL